jgi:hypothetical protein
LRSPRLTRSSRTERHAALVSPPIFLVANSTFWPSARTPSTTRSKVWFFNPLAWQFLFVVGAALGLRYRREWRPAQRLVLPAALIIVVAGFVIKFTWIIHGIWDPFPAVFLKELWPISKGNLSPIRLISFLAMVVIVTTFVPSGAAFLRSPVARPIVLCGQQSLEIFCGHPAFGARAFRALPV